MNTILTIILLILFWVILTPLVIFLVPLSGVVGEMIGGEPVKRTKQRFYLGVFVATMGQCYFYLSYVAFVVSWTESRINSEGYVKYLIWFIAFLSCVIPIWVGATRFNIHHKSKNSGLANILVEASMLTGLFAFVAFFIFNNDLMIGYWGWVPYVGK
ncbi:hypothetical protein AB3G33_01865 [Flavobacterium sp. WC2421]|uniref:hypothetical protein n=1 Tax=Flavobacterium sp. WC2421 TaxID=3234138 RepID=UPI00346660E4